MPKVSVIIPVHNVEKYLGECLDSITGQTLRDIEIICVDDGSTDGSSGILSEYAARDGRLKVFRQAPSGAGAARNRGLAEARGEYLFFCDSDDWIDRDALGAMHASAAGANADIAMTGIRYFDEESGCVFRTWKVGGGMQLPRRPFSPSDMGRDLFPALRPQMGGKLFRREFIESLGVVFQEQPRVNDLAFVAIAIAMAGVVVADGMARYHYRKNHGGNLSSGINKMPEMSTLAWLRVKDFLEGRGLFERFRPAFARGASKSMADSLLAITDAHAAEAFFARVREEFIPALGIDADDAVDAARPFFADGATPLDMFIRRLSQEKSAHLETRMRLMRLRGESKCMVCRFLRRLLGRKESANG